MLLPALKPDVALFHAPMADRFGNVFIGTQRELVTWRTRRRRPSSQSRKSIDGNMLDDPLLAAGTLPGFYVESVAVAQRGAWPLPLPDHYAVDAEHLADAKIRARLADGRPEGLLRDVSLQSSYVQVSGRSVA